MAADRITVVVPAYNNAPWLPRCLDSLLNQTHKNLDIIVVNDGSRDDTSQVLADYTARYDRVMAIHKGNGGVTSARLLGAAMAEGDWIAFVDGDDYVEPQMYQRLLENAENHGAQISHCGHRILFPDDRVTYVHNSGVLRQQDKLTALRDLLDGGQIDGSLCTKLFRRELFEGLENWMDPAIKNGEDLLMNYYLFSRADRAVYEDVCPYHYILRHGSASYRVFNAHSLFDPVLVRQRIVDACEPELQEDARRALLRNCLFAYGQLSLDLRWKYRDYRKKARNALMEQREYFPLLSARNKLLANMVCYTPWLFHIAYGAYVKLFQREEQH